MTATTRIVTVGVAVLAVLAGSERRPSDSDPGSALLSASFATLEAQSSAPVAELVADIRSGGPSGPTHFRVFQNALYFSADDGINGRELWRLDANGVAMVADINPAGSSSPSQLTATADRLYFVATTPAEGAELWQYDGVNPPSPAANINPGPTGGDVLYSTSYANQVVFRGNDGMHGDELFSFDPLNGLRLFDIETVSASCALASDCESSPFSLTVYDGILYFSAFQSGTGFELYSYDGSTYARLTNNIGGATAITGLGNRLIFGGFDFGQYRIYSYEIGSGSGVASKLSDAIVRDPGSLPRSRYAPVVFNNRVYLIANDQINGEELWSSDGTAAGTFVAAEVNAGAASSQPRWLKVFNGELYFEATEPTTGLEPRAFNGTSLRLVADVVAGASSGRFEGPAILGSYIIFQGIGANLLPFYTTGSGASIVEKSGGGLVSLDDAEFTFFNGALYFSGSDSPSGTPSNDELWRITLSASAPTTTTIQSSLNPSIVGDQVTFTATVTGSAPTGTVTFLDGITPLGTVPLVGGLASLDTPLLAFGNHTITAKYNGDASNAPSTSPDLIQVVNKIQTTTTLISSLNPSVFTETVTFTATVSPVSGSGTPTGDVTFYDGLNGLATVALVGNTATLQISTLSGGAHPVTASYAGSATHEASTSNAVQQTVTKLPTTMTLFSSPAPSTVNETVTFSAAVTGAFPTGPVIFSESGVTLGTAPLVFTAAGSIATFQTSLLSVGVHLVTATYGGDTNHFGSAAGDNHTVNDPFPPTPPVADSQTVAVIEDSSAPILLSGSDVNNDPLTFSLVAQPMHGTVSGTPPNVTYTPHANYAGPDSFTFRVYDGTAYSNPGIVTINVTPVNDAPLATNDTYVTAEDTPLIVPTPGMLANDSDVDSSPSQLAIRIVSPPLHGNLFPSSNGAFTYTPNANFNGQDSFTYQATDSLLDSNIATVSITVTPVNDAPVAGNDAYTTDEGTPLTIAAPGVLTNDSDLEGAPLTASVASGPANGTLTLNANGSFTYTPTGSFAGTDSFTYRASDGTASSNAATVTVTVLPRTFTWTATGSLGGRRRAHTATLLPTGKVLVAGGRGQGNSALSSAELYDPVSGIWSATGDMVARRAHHTATVLPNGQVLVAGGESNVLLNSSETYDPATGTWTAAGALSAAHSRHTATLLSNGKVLAVGGYNGFESVAELYDPPTRTWTTTGSLRVGTNFHTATLLRSGQVLVAAGYSPATGATNRAEMYDPDSGAWSDLANLNGNRSTHTATLLPNGKVLVAGGGTDANLALRTTEIFDPATGTWTAASNLNTSRSYHRAVVLPSGRVLVAGGADAGLGPLSSAEVYDPASGLWSPTASLIAGRWSYDLTLLPNGKVLATGGTGASALATAEIYGAVSGAAAAGTWSLVPGAEVPRANHTATRLADGRVLVVGGGNVFTGSYLTSAEIFDPVTGIWSTAGSLAFPRARHTAILLPNHKVLVAAGFNRTGALNSAELFDPATGIWTSTGSLGTPRVSAAISLLPNGRVLIAGGSATSAASTNAEIYDPASALWTPTGSFTGDRCCHTATALGDGRVLIAGGYSIQGNSYLNSGATYDPSTGAWTNTQTMNLRRHSHTATLLPDGRVMVAGGFGNRGDLDRAEVFNPLARNWTSIAAMVSRRGNHGATLLNDGTVLVSGGLGSTGDIATSETFNPTSGSWTARGNLSRPRASHTSTLLLDGRVLVVGGFSNGVLLLDAEIYTP